MAKGQDHFRAIFLGKDIETGSRVVLDIIETSALPVLIRIGNSIATKMRQPGYVDNYGIFEGQVVVERIPAKYVGSNGHTRFAAPITLPPRFGSAIARRRASLDIAA